VLFLKGAIKIVHAALWPTIRTKMFLSPHVQLAVE